MSVNDSRIARSASKESIISAVSHVGEWEIGDRCQIGGRIGNVVYIGQTRFAPGEWIGIVLDEPLGKNDGSVDGHRYFTCEPNHGLFCKSSKLEHIQSPSSSQEQSENNPFCKEYGMDIGDRVIVSGGKCGTLRFLGNTDFKEGVWAGIELDQPVGKNDGSVQGKRYFTCKAPYGLFAAAAKVIRAPEQNPPKIKVRHTKTSALRQRSGSHESLSSIGASSIASSRISKFNISTPRPIQRPIVISSTKGQEDLFKTLQDSLKEKETHLVQMIRERDIERNEMAALSNRCEEAEAKVAQLENTNAAALQQIDALKAKLDETKAKFKVADESISDFTIRLKEKSDALEDITFRYDEETILNAELKERIEELEKRSNNESEEVSRNIGNETVKMREEYDALKNKCSALEQERLLNCRVTNDILSKYKVGFTELMQLVLPDCVDEIKHDYETGDAGDDQNSSEQLHLNLEILSSLLDYHKKVKIAVREKLQKNSEELESLTSQLEGMKKTVNNEADIVLKKNEELRAYESTLEELKKKFEISEAEKIRLEEAVDTLQKAKNELVVNLDSLNERNTELIEKAESEKKNYNVEIVKLKESLQKLQNDLSNGKEEQKRVDDERLKLTESCKFLEDQNKKLTADMEMLGAQKAELENKLRQNESTNNALNASLTKNSAELTTAKLKIEELSEQIDRLRANLCEASSSDESLKKEMETLREENRKESAAHAAKTMQLQSVNESLQKELSVFKNNFQSLESSHNALKNSLEKNQAEFQELEKKLTYSQHNIATEQEKAGKLQQEILSQAEALRQLQISKDEEAAEHAKALSKLHSEIGNIQQRMHDIEVEKENISKEKQELSDEYSKVKKRYEALTQTLKGRVGLANDYEEKMKKLASRVQNIEKCVSSVDCKGKSLEETVENLLAERTVLIDSQKEMKKKVEQMSSENEKQTSELSAMLDKLSLIERERDTLSASLNEIKNKLHETNESLAKEKKDKNSLLTEVAALKEAAASITNVKEDVSSKLNHLNKEKSELERIVSELRKEQNEKDAELSASKVEIAKVTGEMKSKDEVLNSLQEEIDVNKKENNELRITISQLTADLEALTLKSINDDVASKENNRSNDAVAENEIYIKEIEVLKEEKNNALSQINSLKLEILELSQKQAENEVTVAEARQRNALFDDFEEDWKKKEAVYVQTIEELKKAVGKTETEKVEEMKQDIAFLNSIIAEQYEKEKDLKNQISILNSIPANETLAELKHRTVNEAPPRLYCDICEEFDLHDTTECPTQAMDMIEEAGHTHNRANTKMLSTPRPYCDHCEEFGHETAFCPKMQKPKSKDYTF